MAAPGYPQMGQMPPMGGPPMGGPPMGAMPMPRPIRRGTSKAVPIVVSAGLAVGVFCGLLFGVGTGKESSAAVSKGNNVKAPAEEPKPDPGAAPKGLGAAAALPVTPKQATPPPAPAQPPPPAKPEEKKVKLTVQIKPEAAAKDAKISIDGQEITGNSTEVPADKKTVKVEVKASGYRSAEKKIDLVGDELTLDIEMSKRSSGGGTPTVRPPKRIDKPPGPSNSGGGLIDI